MHALSRRFPVAIAAFAIAALPVTANAATWTCETIGATLAPSPSLTLDAGGEPIVVFNSGAQPRLARRAGGAWTGESLVTPPAKDGGAELNLIYYVTPSLAIAGTPAEPRVLYFKAPENDIWFATRTSGVWSYDRLSTAGSTPSLGQDREGVLHATFFDNALGPRHGVLGAGGWTFESAPFAGVMTIDLAGRAQIVTASSPSSSVRWARRVDSEWTVETVEGVDASGVAIAVDGAGEPHLAFADHANQRIRYARRVNGSWSVETVATGVGQWIATAIALGAGGEPFIGFENAATRDFCFARRTSGVWGHEVVEPSITPGGGCALAIDAAGRPHLAYFTSPTTLRYATTTAPVTGVEPGVAPAFAIAAGPNPQRAGGALELTVSLDRPRRVTLELLDAAGRRVDARAPMALEAGVRGLRWTPRITESGLYFLSARSERGERRVARVAVIR